MTHHPGSRPLTADAPSPERERGEPSTGAPGVGRPRGLDLAGGLAVFGMYAIAPPARRTRSRPTSRFPHNRPATTATSGRAQVHHTAPTPLRPWAERMARHRSNPGLPPTGRCRDHSSADSGQFQGGEPGPHPASAAGPNPLAGSGPLLSQTRGLGWTERPPNRNSFMSTGLGASICPSRNGNVNRCRRTIPQLTTSYSRHCRY